MNTKLIESLAKLAKVSDVAAFTEALQSESDTDFQLDTENLVVNTKDELETLKTNIYENAKSDTFKAASEITIKNLKKSVGLEFEGKDPDVFIEKFKASVLEQAQIEPNQKIEEQSKSLDNLRKQLETKDSEIESLKLDFQKKETRSKVESLIPELPEGLGLSKSEATSLFFNSHEVKEDGVYKDGVLLKDEMEKALSLNDVAEKFVSDRGWNKKPSGRGGGAGAKGQPALPKTMAEFETQLKEKGINPGSMEANALLREVAEKNPEILN